MSIRPGEARLCSGAVLALAAGVGVYLCARGAHPLLASLTAWSGPLPTLLHTLAFASLSLAVTRPWPRLAPSVCAAWLLLEGGFELLQVDSVAHVLQARVASGSPLLRAYLGGTFDPLDLLAAVAGVLLAAALAASLGARKIAR